MTPVSSYFETRLSPDRRRAVLWRALVRHYFQALIPPEAAALELGSGYCDFINSVRCGRRYAVDAWPEMPRFAAPGVEARVGDAAHLAWIPDASLDFVFASNLFEHLSQAEFAACLEALKPKLKPSGTLNILQPNYRYAYRQYFDDYTHRSIYSHVSLGDFLKANGFEVMECHPKFLPFTLKSRLPVWPPLVWLYLRSPFKPFAGQMFLRAARKA